VARVEVADRIACVGEAMIATAVGFVCSTQRGSRKKTG
jgi:hypothetical protein